MKHNYQIPCDDIDLNVKKLQVEVVGLSKEVAINRALVLLLAKSIGMKEENLERLEREAERAYLIGLQRYSNEKSREQS